MYAEWFIDGIERWFDVTRWPRWMRRAFILTLPLSGPVYVCAIFATMLVALAWFMTVVIAVAWR